MCICMLHMYVYIYQCIFHIDFLLLFFTLCKVAYLSVRLSRTQSKQRGHLGRNFGYAILGLIVVSGLSSRWQHVDSLHAI